MNSDRNRRDWMQWKTGTSTQNVSILGGETRMASGPMEKGWQTERKAGALEEGGFRKLMS